MFGVVLQISEESQFPVTMRRFKLWASYMPCHWANPLSYKAYMRYLTQVLGNSELGNSELSNCLACKKFVTQILPFSLKLVILTAIFLGTIQGTWEQFNSNRGDIMLENSGNLLKSFFSFGNGSAQVLYIKAVPKYFAKFAERHLWWSVFKC